MESENNLLGQPTHLAGKPKEERSMSEKQGSGKGCTVVVPASPVRMVKPELVEPQEKPAMAKNPRFPTVQNYTRRSIPEMATPHEGIVQRDAPMLSAVSTWQ